MSCRSPMLPPLLSKRTEEVPVDWLDLDAAVVAELRGDGIV